MLFCLSMVCKGILRFSWDFRGDALPVDQVNTTREGVRGVKSIGNTQLVFLDVPGTGAFR